MAAYGIYSELASGIRFIPRFIPRGSKIIKEKHGTLISAIVCRSRGNQIAPVPTDHRQIHSAAMPRQGGVILRSSSFGRFMQILTRQNCIRVGTQTILAKGVKDQLDKDSTEVEIYATVTQSHQELSATG
jgi:hypothetical protein